MSEDMREEIELPELEHGACPVHGHEICACVLWESLYAPVSQRERQLKAALLANREKDAEIARLTAEAENIEGILRAYDYKGDTRDKLIWLESDMLTAQRKQKMLEAQLASLRAGEKWIEIKEGCEMPPVPAIAWTWDGADARILTYTKRGFVGSFGGIVQDTVTHWMTFNDPAPPSTDKES